MRTPKLLFAALAAALAFSAQAADPAVQERAAAPHPSLYSFADVFRLTVSGAVGGLPGIEAAPEAPIRVAAPQPNAAAEPRFAISGPRQPDKWLLVIAGLALAGWVAHRRLVHSL